MTQNCDSVQPWGCFFSLKTPPGLDRGEVLFKLGWSRSVSHRYLSPLTGQRAPSATDTLYRWRQPLGLGGVGGGIRWCAQTSHVSAEPHSRNTAFPSLVETHHSVWLNTLLALRNENAQRKKSCQQNFIFKHLASQVSWDGVSKAFHPLGLWFKTKKLKLIAA